MVVLPTKLKVAEEDGNLGAGNNEDDEHQQKESEDVVVLIHPDRTENEIQLNEAGAEGQDAADQERKGDAHEPGLIRNLAGNVGGVDGELDGLLLVSEVGTEEDQRSRNTEPKDEKDEHGGEGDGIAGSLGQGNDVHDEKDEERNAGETQGGEDSGLLPALALEGLVQAGGVVSSDAAQKDVQEELGHKQRTAVGRAEEAHGSEEDGEDRHAQKLRAGTAADGKKHGGEAGRAEHVGVDKLPAKLLKVLGLLLVGGELVVAGVIAAEVANEDGSDHGGQDEDDDKAVGDAEPVNLGGDGIVHGKIDVPAGGPMEVRVLSPNDVVGEENLAAGELGLAAAGVDHVVVGVDGLLAVARGDGVDDVGNLEGLLGGLGSGAIAVLVLLDGIVVVLGGLELMLDREGLDGEANDTVLAGLGLDGMVHDLQVDVVVHVRLLGVGRNEADRESLPVSGGDGGIVLHLGCRRQVVDDPVIVIVLANGPHDLVGADPLLLSPTEVGDANLLAVHVLLHPKAVRGALDAISDEELAKILIVHLRPALGLAEREAVVIHRKQSLLGRHFVHLHLDAAFGDNIRRNE